MSPDRSPTAPTTRPASASSNSTRTTSDGQFTAANIANGVNILGVTGTLTGGASNCTNDATANCTLDATRSNSDAQFTPANIVCGVNILGVIGNAGDTTPNAFFFSDQVGVPLSTLVTSDIVQISGIGSQCQGAVSISGRGSPEYRTCSTSNCSAVIQNWTSSGGVIQNGQYLQLRLTSSSSNYTPFAATITVDSVSDQWQVMGGSGTTITGITYTLSTTYSGSYTGHQNEIKMRDLTYNAGDTVAATSYSMGTTEWIKADFGSSKSVAAVYIAPIPTSFGGWGVNYVNGRQLECSTDNTNWTPLATTSGHVEGQTRVYIVSQTCRYVRLSMFQYYVAVGDFWFEQ